MGLPAYDDDQPEPHVVETGSPHARYAIVEHLPHHADHPHAGWSVALHAVPYDHESMARLAERNGRPDWAHALRTGTVSTHA